MRHSSFYYVFLKLKVCGNSISVNPLVLFFQQNLLTSCFCITFGNSCITLNLSLWLYLLWWSVISDLWCYYCNCLGHHALWPFNMVNLISKFCMCFDHSTNWQFPHLSPSYQAFLFPVTQNYWNSVHLSSVTQLCLTQPFQSQSPF